MGALGLQTLLHVLVPGGRPCPAPSAGCPSTATLQDPCSRILKSLHLKLPTPFRGILKYSTKKQDTVTLFLRVAVEGLPQAIL